MMTRFFNSMKFILGLKKEMTQIFNKDSGDVIPVTLVKAGPCRIVKIKSKNFKDGYDAVTLGLTGKKKLSRRELGQIKDLGNLAYIKEFRTDQLAELKRGDTITVEIFEVGDKVKVVGNSKGKGFQGVVKRYGFHGQRATHGTKDQERAPGSIGPTEPARVFPGMRMPGHMGAQRVTIKNLEIVKIDPVKNELYIKGAIPGARNGLVMISCPGELKIKKQEEVKPEKAEDKKETAPKAEQEKDKPTEDKSVEKDKQDKKEEK
jgi:large subunit ribosomal protein L3